MRIVHGLFAVGAALFIFGIGFVVVGARDARRTVAAPPPAPVTNVATVKQLMIAVAAPTADAIFNSVQTNITEKGTEEIAPQTDQEWEALGSSAAALAEVGNLLQADGRAVDRGEWITMSRALTDAATQAAAAAAARSTEGILDAGSAVTLACDACHMRYSRQ